MQKQWKQWRTIFGGSKITADGDFSHEIKIYLLLGKKVMTNLDSILKCRSIALPTKVHIVKAIVFPVMYGCENWTTKQAEHWRMDVFELWCWRRLLRVPWTARRSNQSILKEISPDIHWKDWCWCWSSNTTWCKELTHLKRPWCWERLKAGGEGDDRGWDGWIASPTQWKWVWVISGSWWWTEAWRAAVHGFAKSWTWLSDWTELNWVSLWSLQKKETKYSSNSSSLSKWIFHLRYTSKHTYIQTQINNMENFPNILLNLIHSVFLIVSSFKWLNQTQTRSFISVANKSLLCSF